MEQFFTGAFIIVMCLGAIVIGIIALAALYFAWWILIPVICLWVGGWFGFVFGIGLDAVIGLIVLGVSGAQETISEKQKPQMIKNEDCDGLDGGPMGGGGDDPVSPVGSGTKPPSSRRGAKAERNCEVLHDV